MLLYRVLISFFAVALLWRHGRERVSVPGATGAPHVWFHGASNGELASVRPVLARLVSQRPGLHWLVTANTDSGRALVESWDLPGVSARIAPVDLAYVTAQVMRDWKVVAHVTLEAELWPHRIRLCPGPVLVLGARMSAGTARGWARLPRLARRILGRLHFVSAQDSATADRLAALGLPDAARGPVVDLKAYYAPPAGKPDAALTAAFPRAQTWLAASTHEGEDATVLEAHTAVRAEDPGLRLILAPRHPRRAAEIRTLVEARGLRVAQRSLGEVPGGADVYLADTLGEMALWYALAGRVFIAGTLTDRGGHTPYEPATFGAALIHGPDVVNFRAAFGRLRAAGAAREVRNAAELAGALADLRDPSAQVAAGEAARGALSPEAGLDSLCAAILAHLDATGPR